MVAAKYPNNPSTSKLESTFFFLWGLLERMCQKKKWIILPFDRTTSEMIALNFTLNFLEGFLSVRTKMDADCFSPDHWDFRRPSLIIALLHEEGEIRQIRWERERQPLETLDLYFRHLSIFSLTSSGSNHTMEKNGRYGGREWRPEKGPGKMTGPVRTVTKIG